MSHYTVGMAGAAESIVWTIAAPAGVDYTAVSTIALSASVTVRSGIVRTLTAWTFTVLSGSQLKCTLVPTGDEFASDGLATIRSTLTLDGTAYRLPKMPEPIDSY